jgi:hypothetical protein
VVPGLKGRLVQGVLDVQAEVDVVQEEWAGSTVFTEDRAGAGQARPFGKLNGLH